MSWAILSFVRIIIPAVLLALPLAMTAYKDGAPAHMNGGFDEPSCHSCHLDNPLNAPGGALKLAGVPPAYKPGQRYRLTLDLVRDGMERGGFQVSARFASG